MATKFSDVYDRALFKFQDYSFIEGIRDFTEAVLQKFLLSSIADFQHSCRFDLTKYDLVKEEFEATLENEELEILATGIQYHWLNAKMLDVRLLKNKISSKDYTTYSPANLLKVITELRNEVRTNYRGLINTYSFRYSDIDTLAT